MRERLVIAFVGLTLAVIGLYGVPRAYFLADLVREQEWTTLDSTAAALEGLVEERRERGGDVDVELLEHGLTGADRVEYLPAQGEVLVAGGAEDADGGIEVVRDLPGGGALHLSVSGDTVASGVRKAITPLVLLGLVLGLGSALFGFALARRMSRPFQELAVHSRELGHGRFDIDVPSYRVPEAEAIGASLRGAASRLDALVRREREFAANASHQLRTPVTALRLGLEDLTLWPETAPEVRAELERGIAELDRLSAAIDELLDLARGRRLDDQEVVALDSLVLAAAVRWQTTLAADGRELVVDTDGTARTRAATGAVEQVLDVLVENARVHGSGAITVEARDAGTHLEIAVADEGTRTLGPDVFRRGVTSRDGAGHGIGLAVAADLAELCGGHLSLDTASPTTRFVMWLPRVDAPGEEPG
ncbi:signal transduction histidine kinase [Nocardioides sp. J9]|uniref:HAMP domain-containing sensor histidine kinase n=1 Tax=Nocardioides sp. J9 TaxID=935844 RepID=UPI0011A144DC|nr:HAMP domain-containing sensor histidine kinase [Nocardioides sp. J9]TWG91130.1 signal transduction histidine kinase [Nocardioides sp. J9]